MKFKFRHILTEKSHNFRSLHFPHFNKFAQMWRSQINILFGCFLIRCWDFLTHSYACPLNVKIAIITYFLYSCSTDWLYPRLEGSGERGRPTILLGVAEKQLWNIRNGDILPRKAEDGGFSFQRLSTKTGSWSAMWWPSGIYLTYVSSDKCSCSYLA